MKIIIVTTAFLLLLAPRAIAQCQPAQVPYTIDAEGTTPPFVPNCVSTSFTTFSSSEMWETASGSIGGFTGNVLQYDTAVESNGGVNPGIGSNLTSQAIYLPQGNYSVSYKYGLSNPAGVIGRMDVIVSPNGFTAPQAVISTHQNFSGSAVSVPKQSFTVEVAGNYNVAFYVDTQANQGLLYLDDIKVDGSDCASPTGLSVTSVTPFTATLNWNGAVGGPYEFAALPTESGALPATGTATTGSSGVLTGLESETAYVAYVRSACADGTWSIWSQVSFTTTDQLSVPDAVFNSLSVYPNPVANTLTLSNATAIDTAEVYTLTGQLVLSQKLNSNSGNVTVEGLASGVYFLKAYAGNQTKTIKILKQ
ncbi:T9SS type A sorting domain-containing protein [Flavobacterium subsaxonicum]|uniref:Fibronectin type-III domain-containing protein n=1 Tax=Flavobacterium subsaxonicum WB 4.1-42 = DSM 21790 TaxID=1121898 RepID=A0A0A2MJB6_9FLAO|nr:T9SS type A sorting domain-containing protein [Flavobacterium subsaxonicum]KGO91578.1 hypothetical protein Q766_17055 [Flavobacterium subsaxonicum WB 4.1-42 = DSM 21790]